MLDKMLPQDLAKMVSLAHTKYSLPSGGFKELAAIKCIIDFRIALYSLTGQYKKRLKRYQEAALTLHKCLTKETLT
jgi:hypothetical protein